MRIPFLFAFLAAVMAGSAQAAGDVSASAPASSPGSLKADDRPVLKKEPAAGRLHLGQKVLVDDKTCPAGQIKELTGGSNRKCTDEEALTDPRECRRRLTGVQRTSKCVPMN
jgi:hypothetical protein